MPETQRENAASLYINLLAGCLTRTIVSEEFVPIDSPTKPVLRAIWPALRAILAGKDLELVRKYRVDPDRRAVGLDWPPSAETMIGTARIENLIECVESALREHIPGDICETGVWRGGAAIMMRAILKVHGDTERCVWACDSFEGLPKPDPKYAADEHDTHWKHKDYLGVSLETVQANFERYGLLDDRVKFLKGWFRDTLPTAPIERLSVLRLDGDMYESTMDVMCALYPKLSVGGYLIVDDYGLEGKGCKPALDEYRAKNNITEPLQQIDWGGVYWRRVR